MYKDFIKIEGTSNSENPVVFFDISIAEKYVGRIKIEVKLNLKIKLFAGNSFF
jgi:hypothetical protein